MKKVTAAFVIMSSLFISVLYADHASLVPYQDGDKCGYADRDLKIIVKPQFDACGDMIDGMASVYVKGKYGFVDKSGKTVIHPVYTFSTSLTAVMQLWPGMGGIQLLIPSQTRLYHSLIIQ